MNISTLSQSLNLQTSIGKMRSEFTSLQQQLSSGIVSDSYGGLGTDKNVVLSLQSQMRNLGAYSDTINLTSLRVKSMADSPACVPAYSTSADTASIARLSTRESEPRHA